MYNKGDYIVYTNNGVCIIDDLRFEQFGKLERQEFYVLKLLYENGAVVYVPVARENEERRMRAPLTRQEALAMIEDMPNIDSAWIYDDKTRVGRFHQILENGDPKELISIIKALCIRGGELSEMGRKLRSGDEAVMKKAESNLYGELAFALGMEPDEILPYITASLEK